MLIILHDEPLVFVHHMLMLHHKSILDLIAVRTLFVSCCDDISILDNTAVVTFFTSKFLLLYFMTVEVFVLFSTKMRVLQLKEYENNEKEAQKFFFFKQ
jgi:hypothetical protein